MSKNGCATDRLSSRQKEEVSGTWIWSELPSGITWVCRTMPDCGKHFRNWKLVGAGNMMSNSIPAEKPLLEFSGARSDLLACACSCSEPCIWAQQQSWELGAAGRSRLDLVRLCWPRTSKSSWIQAEWLCTVLSSNSRILSRCLQCWKNVRFPLLPQGCWLQRVWDKQLTVTWNWHSSNWHLMWHVQELVVPVLEHDILEPGQKKKKKRH